MTKKNKKRLQMLLRAWFKYWKKLFVLILFIVAMVICVPIIDTKIHPIRYIKSDSNELTMTVAYYQGEEAGQKTISIKRGAKVELREQGEESSKILYDGQVFTVPNENLTTSLEKAIHCDYVYVRRLFNLQHNKHGKLSKTVAKKGEKLKVVSISTKDYDEKTGDIKWYRVQKIIRNSGLPVPMLKQQKKQRWKIMRKILFIRPIGMTIMEKDIPRMPM